MKVGTETLSQFNLTPGKHLVLPGRDLSRVYVQCQSRYKVGFIHGPSLKTTHSVCLQYDLQLISFTSCPGSREATPNIRYIHLMFDESNTFLCPFIRVIFSLLSLGIKEKQKRKKADPKYAVKGRSPARHFQDQFTFVSIVQLPYIIA